MTVIKGTDDAVEATEEPGFHSALQGRSISGFITNRLFNVVVAAVLLTGTGPLLALIAVAIKCESPGPVLHRQSGVGRGGRRFELLSFRTVEWEQGWERWGRDVTRVGRFLRYTRIEALPQLINVLRGEINLIDVDYYSSSFWL